MKSHFFQVPKTPIQVFSVADFGIDIENFLKKTQTIFYQLPLDAYDCRKEQVTFLQDNLPHVDSLENNKKLYDYYLGNKGKEIIEPLYAQLSEEKKIEFDKIKPFRRRAVSNFILEKSGDGWMYQRVPTPSFSQTEAKIEEDRFDFRSLPRNFTEISEDAVSYEDFKKLLKGIACKVGDIHPEVKKLDITAHHVLVETAKERITSNSPEGIHQDGYDYIVSALVVERKNISGGISEIFANDKKSKILSTTLQPGFGLLQPDLNTDLWHHVTKIQPTSDIGFRSSIGFDIALIR